MLWLVAPCSDDLAAAHYRLKHAVRWWAFGPQLNLTTFLLELQPIEAHFWWLLALGGCTLWVIARRSDDLATAHYRLAHAVPMVCLWPTTEPNHIFYWNYNRLKHSLGDCTLWVVARCSDDLAAAHYRLMHAVPMT